MLDGMIPGVELGTGSRNEVVSKPIRLTNKTDILFALVTLALLTLPYVN